MRWRGETGEVGGYTQDTKLQLEGGRVERNSLRPWSDNSYNQKAVVRRRSVSKEQWSWSGVYRGAPVAMATLRDWGLRGPVRGLGNDKVQPRQSADAKAMDPRC